MFYFSGAVVRYQRDDSQDDSIVFDYGAVGPAQFDYKTEESGSEDSENSEVKQSIDATEEFYGVSIIIK